MASLLKAFWLASIVLLIVQALMAYGELPERMAIRFDWDENPSGWAAKNNFYLGWLALIIFINLWPVAPRYVITKLPAKWISIPEKKFWLANDTRKAKLCHIMQTSMTILFTLVNISFLITFQYTYDFNVRGTSSIPLRIVIGVAALVTPIPVLSMVVKLSNTKE